MNLPWLQDVDPFPPLARAWGKQSPAPGLLAAGGGLSVERLQLAYSQGIFPWYSDGQPVLWWSPDPRMVLETACFRLHRSLGKTLTAFRNDPECEIRVDHDFAGVIQACSAASRNGQSGTWIGADMQQAYIALHRAGMAHSVETWRAGKRVGGLYCVAIGQAVFGESMYSQESNASKIALSALVALCRRGGVSRIDCQQNTAHLASLGAREMARSEFVHGVAEAYRKAPLNWEFQPLYWAELLPTAPAAA